MVATAVAAATASKQEPNTRYVIVFGCLNFKSILVFESTTVRMDQQVFFFVHLVIRFNEPGDYGLCL